VDHEIVTLAGGAGLIAEMLCGWVSEGRSLMWSSMSGNTDDIALVVIRL
jgi:hypothetical protein